MNTTELQGIRYPVYKLPYRPNVDDGVIYYYGEKETDGEAVPFIHILDDKNVDGDSLAVRRLHLMKENVKLFNIKKAIYFLGDLIKLAAKDVVFIDSNGKLFDYKKTSTAKLKFHKITRILPIVSGGAIIEVDGVNARFKTLTYPSIETKCAGVLHMGASTILYGLYPYVPEDTVRRV